MKFRFFPPKSLHWSENFPKLKNKKKTNIKQKQKHLCFLLCTISLTYLVIWIIFDLTNDIILHIQIKMLVSHGFTSMNKYTEMIGRYFSKYFHFILFLKVFLFCFQSIFFDFLIFDFVDLNLLDASILSPSTLDCIISLCAFLFMLAIRQVISINHCLKWMKRRKKWWWTSFQHKNYVYTVYILL